MNTFTSIITIGFVFLIFLALFVRVSYKYREEQDLRQLVYAALLLVYIVIPSGVFFIVYIRQWTAAPVVSSCEMIITEQGDTLYEFEDATRFCSKSNDTTTVSNIFTIRKTENVKLLRRDTCLHCQQQLREHSRSQTIYSPEETLDGWDGVFFPY